MTDQEEAHFRNLRDVSPGYACRVARAWARSRGRLGAATLVAMTRDEVLAICLNLPAAEETYPFGDDVAVIKVGGKMFALVPLSGEPGSVNLKCDPVQALALRETYAGIRPGYHQNKRHWNTVDLDGSVEDDLVRELIADSYDLVVAGLPRSVRAELVRD